MQSASCLCQCQLAENLAKTDKAYSKEVRLAWLLESFLGIAFGSPMHDVMALQTLLQRLK